MRQALVLALLALLYACHQPDEEVVSNADRARFAGEERQLRAALALTRSLSQEANEFVLYEVVNELDGEFAQMKSGPRVAGLPIRGAPTASQAAGNSRRSGASSY
jgi:hypothetical protein